MSADFFLDVIHQITNVPCKRQETIYIYIFFLHAQLLWLAHCLRAGHFFLLTHRRSFFFLNVFFSHLILQRRRPDLKTVTLDLSQRTMVAWWRCRRQASRSTSHYKETPRWIQGRKKNKNSIFFFLSIFKIAHKKNRQEANGTLRTTCKGEEISIQSISLFLPANVNVFFFPSNATDRNQENRSILFLVLSQPSQKHLVHYWHIFLG